MKLDGKIENTAQPAAGMGLALAENGLIPPSVIAPTPVASYVLVWDGTTNTQKWAQITSAGITDGTIVDADVSASAGIAYTKLNLANSIVTGDIVDGTIVNADVSGTAALGISKLSGYPADSTKFLRGDGTWATAGGAYASSSSTPADPTGTTSATGVMMGLAGTITPTQSGKVLILVQCQGANNTIGDGCKPQIRTGTGTAPTNGAALTGTAQGASATVTQRSNAADLYSVTLAALVTGLTLSTAVWIDLSVAAVTGGTAKVVSVAISAVEVGS